MDARRLYGLGVFVLGIGNVVFGVAQLVTGGIGTPVVGALLGAALAVLGVLVLTDSDRMDGSALSDRALVIVGAVGLAIGALLLINGVGLLVR